MRTSRISPRSGLFVAAVAAPLALVASPVSAASGPLVVPTQINVTSTGTAVQVTTSSCPNGGDAYLMASGNTNFLDGEKVSLAGSGANKSASWQGVSPGTYVVQVVCQGGDSAGAQRVTVSSSPSASASPTSPTGQVRGGLGGGAPEDAGGQIAGGATLALTAGLAGAWLIRRHRSRSRGSHS